MAVAQKLSCRVTRVEDHGDRVYTIDLASDRLFPLFKPGQFLHLALDAYDPTEYWPESRVFSIVCSPRQRDRLRLTYSVRGRFTARMENELKEGKTVWVKLPYGDFVIQTTGDVVLLAGGTGITAFVAYLSELPPDPTQNVYLAYGARKAELLVYRRLVDDRANAVNGLRCWYFIEEPYNNSSPTGSQIAGKIKTLSCDLANRDIKKEAIQVDAWE